MLRTDLCIAGIVASAIVAILLGALSVLRTWILCRCEVELTRIGAYRG